MNNGRSEVEQGLMKITKTPHRITLALLFTTLVVVIVLLIPRAKFTATPISNAAVYDGLASLETELYVYNATYPLTERKGGFFRTRPFSFLAMIFKSLQSQVLRGGLLYLIVVLFVVPPFFTCLVRALYHLIPNLKLTVCQRSA